MSHTFGFTGMDPATESSLRVAFVEASRLVGGGWMYRPDDQAEYVVVDMDSMYGPMSWLRLHAAGRTVIGLTTAARTQTPFRLGRPFDAAAVAQLLREITGAGAASVPAGMTPSPQPQDQLPEERPRAPDEERAPAVEPAPTPVVDEPLSPQARAEPPSAAAGRAVPPAPSLEPHLPSVTAPPEPQTLGEWLGSGKLRGRLRIERAGQTLLIDADERQYYGPAALKPLASMFDGRVALSDFQPVDAEGFAAQSAAMGPPQTLARLLWFGAMLAGKGRLTAGFDVQGRYHLLKWPQTEREFPKHFRIATAMMKGPAKLDDIADASGVPLAEVIDFVNANLATGYVAPDLQVAPTPETPKGGGLFGRLRGR